MTDKIKKFLKKLSRKDLDRVEEIILRISKGQDKGLNVLQLKGTSNIYRVRKGKIRIIYSLDADRKIRVLDITRRSEKTYKNQ